MENGVLVLAATPIGSAADASESLRVLLAEADIIAAEDTRVLKKLLLRLGVTTKARVVAYFEGNEGARTGELIDQLVSGAKLALVTDAGMPSVSDPGFRLVNAAISAGIRVSAVPGPSAVLTALAVSGLPCDRFCFEGFLPRKSGERLRRFGHLAGEERTMVFFEAPHRLASFLQDAVAVLGADRPGAICRELTKPYEEIIRGSLSYLTSWAQDGVRGEVTVVLGGAAPKEFSSADALSLVHARMAVGIKLSTAVAEVAELTGVNRRTLYGAAVTDKEIHK